MEEDRVVILEWAAVALMMLAIVAWNYWDDVKCWLPVVILRPVSSGEIGPTPIEDAK
jgi:hypothetical protein